MMTREVFAISWAKVPATPNDTDNIRAAMKTWNQCLPKGIARLRPCAFSRINRVTVPMLKPMRRIPQGEISSRAMRIAVQLSPQQKLSATSRSLATVALLIAGFELTDHRNVDGKSWKTVTGACRPVLLQLA